MAKIHSRIFILFLFFQAIGFLAVGQPTVTSFTPTSGPIGTTVTITGTNFSTTPASNIVYFGATKATVTAATATQLTVTVPTGATYQPITVLVSGLAAFSQKPFLVTFPDGGTINACSFASPVGFGSGSGAWGIALGDLDGDGKTDVAIPDYFANSIRVFRNTSTVGAIDASSFSASVDFPVGTNPYQISIADIDGDGKLDIVASSWGANIISIFRNTSTVGSLTTGSFAARLDLATGSFPFNISCQDLDGDGKTDIAVSNAGSGSVSIWQNIGSPGSITAGSFNTRLDVAGPSTGFTIADVDLDGKPDLIGGYNLGSSIGISRNISSPGTLTSGSFSAPVDFAVAAWPEHIVVGDLDADNRPDIVTSSWPGNKISILKNTSTPGPIVAGSFAAAVDIDGNIEPRGVWITDFDGDGLPDIGLSNQTSNVSIYKNANTPGSITSASFLPKVNFSGTGNARDVMGGDIDGDGRPDLVVATWGSPSLMVLRNTVSSLPVHTITGFAPVSGNVGTTVTLTGTNFSTTPSNNTVKFNGVTATVSASTATSLTVTVPTGATTGTISVMVQCNTVTTTSSFILPPTISSFTPDSGPIGTTVTITGTSFSTTPSNNIVYFGATRATVTAATSTELTVTVPVGATFKPIIVSVNGLVAHAPRPFVVTFAGGGAIDNCSFAPAIAVGTVSISFNSALCDLDGDGKMDLLVPERSNNQLAIFRNTSVSGTVSFTPKIPFTGLTEAISTATGDLDGDGKPDIAVANYTNGQLSIYKNLSTPGNISVAARVIYSIPAFTHDVSIADIDGDGKQDLIISASIQGLIVMRNQGLPGVIDATTFAAGGTFATGANAYPFALGDLDGDGKIDVVVPNANTYTLSVLRNTSTPGSVSFAASVTLTTNTGTPTAGYGTAYVALGDVDGDAKMDIVAVSNTVTKLSLFRNTSSAGSLSFDPRFDIATTGIGGVPAFSDLNGDGKLDLVADDGSLQMLVFENTASPGVIASSSFKPPIVISRLSSYTPQLGDVDGDGRNEIITTSASIQVFRNRIGQLPPVITDVTPLSGAIGTAVTITGTDFDPEADNNIVSFNGAAATIATSTATSIETVVPAGATSGFITVTVGCNSATSSSPFTVPCVSSLQRAALVKLYNDTGGASWTNNSGWLSPNEDDWYGVTVTGCDVTGVILENNNLINSLPAEIGDLSGLMELNLSHNHLSGALPATLANCTALEIIDLEDNQLTGTIPTYFPTLPNLYSINLGFNQFSGSITSNLGTIGPLEFLSLASNQLTGSIPTELGSLTNLTLLDLSRNQLSGSIPTSLGSLPLLNSLLLWSNQLTGPIPSQLGNIATLENLNLSDNQLTGSIPNSLGSIAGLLSLELNQNQLSGVIPDLGSTSLTVLKLSDNMITGSIPVTLSTLTDLIQLDLDRNQLTGILPPELGLLTNLEDLNVNDNQLSGSLPIEYGNLTKLLRFRIANNSISGPIPNEYLAWNDIEILSLGNNLLDGIPTFTAPGITELTVDYNYLEFGDLEPNLSVQGFAYNPQNDLPGGVIVVGLGDPLSIPFVTSGSANQYQWFKDGVLIPGATSSTFSIASTAFSDEGNYTIAITSSIVTGMTLNSLPFEVTIPDIIINVQPVDVSVCDGATGMFSCNSTGADNITYQWQFSPNGPPAFVDIGDGSNYSGTTSASLTVNTTGGFGAGRYRCRINGDLTTEVITDDKELIIIPIPAAPTTSPANSCTPANLTLNAFGGVNGQYRWYTTSTGGVPIAGEINSSFTTPLLTTTATYYVAINNGMCEGPRTSAIAQIDTAPSAPLTTGNSGCGSAAMILQASGGTNGQYRWYDAATGGTAIAGEINSSFTTPVLSATTIYFVSINNGTCESARTSVVAQIDTQPSAPTTTNGSSCGPAAVTLTASGGTDGQYRWYTTSTGGVAIAGEVNSTYTTPSLSTTSIYFASIHNGTCESARTSVTAQINTVPAPPTASGATGCLPASVTLTAAGGSNGQYRWYSVATGGTAIAGETNSSYVTPVLSASATYYVSINDGTCESSRTSVAATLTNCAANLPPVIAPTVVTTQMDGKVSLNLQTLISDPDGNIDLTKLKIVSQPISGAPAFIDVNQILIIDYKGIVFTGTDELTIEVCDLAGSCTQQKITIEVEGDIVIYNGISANGDQLNPIFEIKNIDLLESTKNNRVSIFNRWGSKVFEAENYNNTTRVFTGVNQNGNELPSGTYFYKIEFSSGRETQTGYLTLKR